MLDNNKQNTLTVGLCQFILSNYGVGIIYREGTATA